MNGENRRTHILELRVRNVKSIKEVAIDTEGDIHEIRGDSGQGKTSILESIEGGLRGLNPDMVRNGQDPAEIEIHLSDSTIINRITPTDGKEKLMVTRDGAPVEKAKDFLKSICGPSAFRPIQWVKLGGGEGRGRTERLRKQRDQLLQALPLELSAPEVVEAVKDLGPEHAAALGEVNLDEADFSQHALVVCSEIEAACYEYRSTQNALAEDAEKKLEFAPAPECAAPVADLATCEERLEAATKAFHKAEARVDGKTALIEQRDTLRLKINEAAQNLPEAGEVEARRTKAERQVETSRSEIQRLEEALEKERGQLKAAKRTLDECGAALDRLEVHQARLADLEAVERELAETSLPDLEELKESLGRARMEVEARRLQNTHDVAAETAISARERANLFSDLVKLFRDDLPKRLIEKADLPIPGLGVDADKILIDGIPLHQLGTSDQIQTGVMVAAALNPRSGFVLVDGAESLGRKDRLALAEAARSLGLQLILTIVDEDAKPSPGVTVMREGEAVPA